MTVIGVSDLAVSFGTNVVLDGVTFALNENDKLGVIGVNGCGKSTLFKLLTGEIQKDRGEVFLAGGKTLGVVEQHDAFRAAAPGACALSEMIAAFPELLSAEAEIARLEEKLQHADEKDAPALSLALSEAHAAFARAGGLEFRARCASVLLKMGFDEEEQKKPLNTLSGGQRTRLALSRQLCREPDVLLLDEPTNHLDIETTQFLENYLAQYKKCVLVISHDRYFLDRVTNKTLVIERGRAKLYEGAYTASAEKRKTEREIEERHYRNQQKEIARQEAYIAQQRAWNRERNIVAAESRMKLLAKMEKLDKPTAPPRAIRLSFGEALQSGTEVLTVKDLSVAFGAKTLFSGLNFLLTRGERLVVIGPNGCGKSTLLRLLLGKIPPGGGKIVTGYNVTVGYYDQENQNLDAQNTVLDELWSAYPRRTETEIRTTLAGFCFVGDDVYRKVGVLSGGERARLTLAKLILSEVNLLVLDEPTNHLDIDSREVLEDALSRFGGTVIAVSHDRYFINKLATRVLAFPTNNKGALTDYRVSAKGAAYDEFSAFAHSQSADLSPADARESVSERKAEYLARKQSAAEERRENARRERLKKEAAALETRIEEIDGELYGEAASDYTRAAALDAEKSAAEERLLQIYEEIGV